MTHTGSHASAAAPTGATPAAPAADAERITSLDVLRGFALLGIIVMNVQSFSMPIAAYFNPTAYGSLDGANGVVWLLGHLFVDQKFMNLFAILFGAGVLLFADRAESKGASPRALHYRRMLWLLAFGLVHAYLLWYGDVLTIYALCALALYPLRKLSPRALIALGVGLFAVASAIFVAMGATYPTWPAEMQADARADWAPTPAQLDEEARAYRGGWTEQMAHRVPEALTIHTLFFATFLFWRVSGLMLIGMALLKSGVLAGQRSPAFYGKLAAAGLGLGLPLIAAGVVYNTRAGWTVEASMFLGAQFNYWGALLVALGYVGLVLLAARVFRRAARLVANVGVTAFSSYILQTIAMTTVFYGHALGLFGTVPRTAQAAIALGVVALNVALATLWLRRFRMGPLEWLWRTLTYGRMQPIRRAAAPA